MINFKPNLTSITLNTMLYSTISRNKITVYYDDALEYKDKILRENKNKSGIYKWTNKITNKSYVGSSINLYNRFLYYYNTKTLEQRLKVNKSLIYNSLLKYGYNNFTLEILIYSEKNDKETLLKLEQYYLDTLKPEYNILKFAGSMTGFKHSPETLLKFRYRKLNSIKLVKKDKISTFHLNKTNHLLSVSYKIVVINVITNEVKNYNSLKSASLDLQVTYQTVSKYMKNKLLFKNTFYINRII